MNVPGLTILKSKIFTNKIIKSINKLIEDINRPLKLMHVCGTHENTISKYGLRSLLSKEIEFVRW